MNVSVERERRSTAEDRNCDALVGGRETEHDCRQVLLPSLQLPVRLNHLAHRWHHLRHPPVRSL